MSGTVQAQSYTDARFLTLGASGAAIRDTRDFSANPAGLVQMRDWDLSVATYTEPSHSQSGFVFHELALGKRFLTHAAAAFRYSPGSDVSFVAPPALFLGDSNLPESQDREITYREPYALGAAYRISEKVAVGIGIRNRQEHVVDTRYQLVIRDTIIYPTSVQETSDRSTWLGDVALAWEPSARWSISMAGRNLVRFSSGDESAIPEAYRLPTKVILEGGLRYAPMQTVQVLASATTAGMGGLGAEWLPGSGFALRGGVLANRWDRPFVNAATVGVGWSFESFEIDAAYLRFLSVNRHRGSLSLEDFSVDQIIHLDFHPHSRDRIALTAKAVFGRIRESLARIEGVTMISSVYPAARELFAYKPIGTARVRNISSQPIHAKASFFVERVMDAPTESQPVYLEPGGEADIPLTAVFNEQVERATTQTVREGNVYIHATPAEQYDDKAQTRVVFQGKNAWDGDVYSLRYFVTPDHPAILKYSRDVLLERRDSLAGVDGVLEQYHKARLLLAGFAGNLQYVSDPRLSADYVQYPVETLSRHGGDCDDLAVCFASLLSSIGIAVAFVDVIPPGKPGEAHLYLLMDTGMQPRFGSALAQNPKRYVIRSGTQGKESVWIPIETTVLAKGFDEAWTAGAQRYFDDVEVGFGLAHGWVRIVDVH